MKVAAGVINTTPLDWENNLNHCLTAIQEAKKQQVSILCLPELCLSGYGCEDMFWAENTIEKSFQSLLTLVSYTKDIAVSVGLPIRVKNRIYNACAWVVNQKIEGFIVKKNLANDGIHYERRWFQAWKNDFAQEVEFNNGEIYWVGDLLFDLEGVKIGFEICEDAWVPQRAAQKHITHGVDVILNPSASHFAFYKTQTRELIVREASRALEVVYVYTNLLGNESGRAIFDGDALIAQSGEILCSGERFSYQDCYLLTATVDIEKSRLNQSKIFLPAQELSIPKIIKIPFQFPENQDFIPSKNHLESWESKGFQKEEEMARGICLGLFDYLRKSRSKGFVISLSGGADSSACVALGYLMVELCIQSIGLEGLKKKLDYITEIQYFTTKEEITHFLLTAVYQSTRNSSKDTLNSAKGLTEGLGISFAEISVDGLVEDYKTRIEGILGRNLDWGKDDVALQNIQARVRVPSIWLIANLKNALLLATSNRSEVAVGYATMDGDTAGSISPLSGIDKHFLRHWLVWLEKTGLDNGTKIASLSFVNALIPTAELRPLHYKQTDEDDLMPYHVLNTIEYWMAVEKKSPLQCFKKAKIEWNEFSEDQLRLWITRFFKLWARNQWKRERYAPGFHLDSHSLDPKTWFRFPILSSGFHTEIEELNTLK